MAAFTSKAAGDWSASGQTTWNEVGIPGAGDTVTITHAITVTDARIIGTYPVAGTDVVTVNAGGTLSINSGGQLTLRGDLRTAAATGVFAMNGTGSLIFDSTGAASPTTTSYRVICANASSVVAITGSAGSRTSVTSLTTGGALPGRFTNNGGGGQGRITASYCDFSFIGNASTQSFNALATTTGQTTTFDLCTFDNCGQIFVSFNGNQTGVFRFDDCKTTNSLNTTATLDVRFNGVGSGGFVRSVARSSFDKKVSFTSVASITFDNCYFAEYVGGTQTLEHFWVLMKDCLVRISDINGMNIYGNTQGCYFFNHGWTAVASGYNTYLWRYLGTTQTLMTSVDDTFESTQSTSWEGKTYAATVAGFAPTVPVIFQATGVVNASRVYDLFDIVGHAQYTIKFDHCTSWANRAPRWRSGSEQHVGMLGSYKSNILFDTSAPAALPDNAKFVNLNAVDLQDLFNGADADYNCGWNLNAGVAGKGYDNPCTVAPGAHDVDVNPGFVDSSRGVASWYRFYTGTTTGTDAGDITAALALIANDTTLIITMRNWVRGGFAPTNALLQGTAHDAGDIGAVAVVLGHPASRRFGLVRYARTVEIGREGVRIF